MNNHYVAGEWNAVCDRCGFHFKSGALKKEWTGLMVCGQCWEPRHPQTLIKVPEEQGAPPWTRPEPEDVFIDEPTFSFDFSATPLTGQYAIVSTFSITSDPSGIVTSSVPTAFKWTLTDTVFGASTIVRTTTSPVLPISILQAGLYDVKLEVYNGDTLLDTKIKPAYINVEMGF